MKRLIDGNLLLEKVNELVDAELFNGEKICIGDIRSLIEAAPTVVCVSDDFTLCHKEISCNDIMCGGACCEKP